jgi:hemolysin-activating ACP:hemolysin acyltransferase
MIFPPVAYVILTYVARIVKRNYQEIMRNMRNIERKQGKKVYIWEISSKPKQKQKILDFCL